MNFSNQKHLCQNECCLRLLPAQNQNVPNRKELPECFKKSTEVQNVISYIYYILTAVYPLNQTDVQLLFDKMIND